MASSFIQGWFFSCRGEDFVPCKLYVNKPGNHVYGLGMIFGLWSVQLYFLCFSVDPSSPLPGYWDESKRSALAYPLNSVLYFIFLFWHCVFIWIKTSYCNKSTTSPFSYANFPCYWFCYRKWCFFFFFLFCPLGSVCIQWKWDFWRDSSGSTYYMKRGLLTW